MRIIWKDSLTLGVPSADAEHHAIHQRLNLFLELHQSGGSSRRQKQAFNEVLRITEEHFASEEKLLDHAGFPNLAAHAAVHAVLMEQLRHFESVFANPDRPVEITPMAIDFLQRWLCDHIEQHDMAYRPYVRNLS